jgi:hypothetical protein
LGGGDSSDIEVTEAYFRLFDDFLFFSALVENTKVEYVDELENCYHAKCYDDYVFSESEGESWDIHGPSSHGKSECLIRIKTSSTRDREVRLTKHLSLLLHEMCHAFLTSYACRARRYHLKASQAGKDSHGEAWCDLALSVEQGVEKTFGLRLDLDRRRSYAWGLLVAGGLKSSKIGEWGFSENELKDKMARLCSDDDVGTVDGGQGKKRWKGVIAPVLIVTAIVLLGALA